MKSICINYLLIAQVKYDLDKILLRVYFYLKLYQFYTKFIVV